jgi:hypothetical protein
LGESFFGEGREGDVRAVEAVPLELGLLEGSGLFGMSYSCILKEDVGSIEVDADEVSSNERVLEDIVH